MCSYSRGGCTHENEGTIAEAEKQTRTQVGRVDNTSVCGEKVVPAGKILRQIGDRNHKRTGQKAEGRMKAKVTERALLQRINRKLKADGEKIVKARNPDRQPELGAYYVIHVERNMITSRDVDPAELAEELGCLRGWEKAEL
jgi:hypothetical protein